MSIKVSQSHYNVYICQQNDVDVILNRLSVISSSANDPFLCHPKELWNGRQNDDTSSLGRHRRQQGIVRNNVDEKYDLFGSVSIS